MPTLPGDSEIDILIRRILQRKMTEYEKLRKEIEAIQFEERLPKEQAHLINVNEIDGKAV